MANPNSTQIAFDNLMYESFEEYKYAHLAFEKMSLANSIRADLDADSSVIPGAMYIYDPFTALGYAASFLVCEVVPVLRAEYLERRAKQLAPQLFEA